MLRSLATLPLPGLAPIKFRENGFLYCEDIWNEKGFVKDGVKILQQCNLENSFESLTEVPTTRSALDVWQEECSTPNIVTFCKELDIMLEGGVPLGQVTEFSGAPGSGKTQMCLQLCVDVHIPESLGGVAGKAIFIDSSHSFSPARFKELAVACVTHCHAVDPTTSFTTETVMKGVYYMSVNDHIQLIAAVESIEDFLHNTPEVVVTNQLTTRIDSSSEWHLVPSMGDSFGHLLNQRLLLGRLPDNCFAAMLLKSATSPQKSTKFQVVEEGIRSCAT